MELSWSTFVLEIINFLVLVWILTRFLYRPVLDVIARRRGEIEKKLADAQDLERSAHELKEKYENRLSAWQTERRQALETLNGELAEERTKQLATLQTELAGEREKASVSEARRLDAARRQIEETALTHGAKFASRLLEELAGPELHARLVHLLVEQLGALQPDRAAALAEHATERVVVGSALPLTDEQRGEIGAALARVLGTKPSIAFEEQSDLRAGLRVTIGAFNLGMNLRDELEGFVGSVDEEQQPA